MSISIFLLNVLCHMFHVICVIFFIYYFFASSYSQYWIKPERVSGK